MKKIKIAIIIILILGCLGFISSLICSKQKINEFINKNIDIKTQANFNNYLMNEVLPIKEMIGDIIQMRKVNSDIDRISLQKKIFELNKYISKVIDNLNTFSLSENQENAKIQTSLTLNEIKYNLELLNKYSKEKDFPSQGVKKIDEVWDNINSLNLQIDDCIGIDEKII